MQPPLLQVPKLPLRTQLVPLAMHTSLFWSQQPPEPHALPGQQISPGAPHAVQVPLFGSHAMPDAVQKSAAPLLPWQHFSPAPPQLLWVPVQPPAVHAPPMDPPQDVAVARQTPPTQHAPAPVHVSVAQHGWPVPPHATELPLSQTVGPASLVDVAAPEATQPLPMQQPPPPHTLPAQHGWPGMPHAGQLPALQVPPFVQVAPLAKQTSRFASQQPPLPHVLPGQQTWPGPPQASQVSFWPHARPAPVHVRPAQHGWPGPPHTAHTPF